MGLFDVIEGEIKAGQDTTAVQAVTEAGRGKTSLDELIDGIRHGWPVGKRNNGLLSMAGFLRAPGLPAAFIDALLCSVNKSTGMNLPNPKYCLLCGAFHGIRQAPQ